jgi:coenzyme Q-binding protein COQ10
MFDLVADVAHYGEFLPWVNGIRIRSNSETEMVADMIVGFKGLRETFSSRVCKARPDHIEIDYLDGPMRHLRNEWRFTDLPDGGSRLEFMVDFEFKSRMFQALAGQVFERALKKMTDAFIGRAAALYGDSPGSSSSSATRAA